MRKTQGVKNLVEEALASLPTPHTEDVIQDVFLAIASRSDWHREYDDLCGKLTNDVVNPWGAKWVRIALGMPPKLQENVPSQCTLIGTYSTLSMV